MFLRNRFPFPKGGKQSPVQIESVRSILVPVLTSGGDREGLVHHLSLWRTPAIETPRGELCVSEILILGSTQVAKYSVSYVYREKVSVS